MVRVCIIFLLMIGIFLLAANGIIQAKASGNNKSIRTTNVLSNSDKAVSPETITGKKQKEQSTTPPLSFEERVNCQRAIDEVYWRYMNWPKENKEPKPPLEKVESIEQIRAKVEDYLRKSNALEYYWQTAITAEQLQAEMERMAKYTKQPKVLKELWGALNNDPYLIAECFVQPLLADNLTRDLYAHDPRFYADAKAKAEADLQQIFSFDTLQMNARNYTEVKWVNGEENDKKLNKTDTLEKYIVLNSTQWNDMLIKLAKLFGTAQEKSFRASDADLLKSLPIGRLSSLQADEENYYVQIILSKSQEVLHMKSLIWAKQLFDDWWKEARRLTSLDLQSNAGNYVLPEIKYNYCGSDEWYPTSTTSAPAARYEHSAIWTGVEMIIYGGYNGTTVMASGAKYSPDTDTWSLMAGGPISAAHSAIWTGSEMITFGGYYYYAYPNCYIQCFPNQASCSDYHESASGGRYNPLTNSWVDLGTTNCGRRSHHKAVWTGSQMLLWGGKYSYQGPCYDAMCCPGLCGTFCYDDAPLMYGSVNIGCRYDPISNSWTSINIPLSARSNFSMVWIGNKAIIWGGKNESTTCLCTGCTPPYECGCLNGPQCTLNTQYFNDGGSIDPVMNSWSGITVAYAPSARSNHTAVWTGSEMIVWGGGNATSTFNDGGKYNPSTDSWIPTSLTNAPAAKVDHTAVWTGARMIVWGGNLNTGGRYNPETDTWLPTSATDAPTSRSKHTAVWAGEDMLVWGGNPATNTGGDYYTYDVSDAPLFGGIDSALDSNKCQATGIQIKWRQPCAWGQGATSGSYEIRRYDGPLCTGTYITIASNIPEGATTKIDTSATPEIIYSYQMVATNNATPPVSSTGTNSCAANASDSIGSQPSELINNSATDSNGCADSGVRISWNKDPSTSGNWGDSGYGIRTYAVLRDGTAIVSSLSYGTTNYIDSKGTNDTLYSYSVRYTNGCGLSSITAGVQAMDSTGLPPSGLVNNNASDNGCADAGVKITWEKDPTSWGDGSMGTRTYDVLRDGVIRKTLTYGITTYLDTLGVNETTYLYSIKYNNGCGLSGTTSGTPAADNLGFQPSGLTNNTAIDIDYCADIGVQITWAADPADWGDFGTGTRTYSLMRFAQTINSIPYGTTSYIDTTGTNGSLYHYIVRYYNKCGFYANTIGADAEDSINGGVPSGLYAITAADYDICADTGVLITWAADPTDWGDCNMGTRTYSVLRDSTIIATTIPYGTTNFIDVTGINNTFYAYRVRYYNGNGSFAETNNPQAADTIQTCTLLPNKPLVDDSAGSIPNGIIEEDEIVSLIGVLTNAGSTTVTQVVGKLTTSDPIVINNTTALYPDIPPTETRNCIECYSIIAPSANRPATHWDFSVSEYPCLGCTSVFYPFTYHVGNSFDDVSPSNIFYSYIEKVLHSGVTSGCTATTYCPNALVQRQHMAKFICASMEAVASGSCTVSSCVNIFADVSSSNPFCPYIEALYNAGMVSGCQSTPQVLYCPGSNTQRQAMAKFICNAMQVTVPGSCVTTACTGIFSDVTAANPFCGYIEALYNAGVISGCSTGIYCPYGYVSRDQMAKFLANAFGFTL